MQKDILWQSDKEDGRFTNPILFADYSDPDVIRVGETYYMTASSFNFTPALPILVSKDLVNWTLKHYALNNIGEESYNIPAHSQGVWAPAIRYHDDYFWIFYGMPDEGIYSIHAKDPLGTWSDPILLLPGKGYIDPCPFWDDDGRAYIIHGYAKSRIGFNSIIGIFEMSTNGEKVLSHDEFIYDGTVSQPTIEGPKIYKKNGYYYIFAPAGGVTHGWQTVLRSKNIMGPYEEKIVMAQRDTNINGPHQGALVDTLEGEEWFIHFQDRGVYGRIIHLQPVQWTDDDWPIIGVDPDTNGCGKPMLEGPKPKCIGSDIQTYLEASDNFEGRALGLQWQWLGNHSDNFYSLIKEAMRLRLYSLNPSGDQVPTLWRSANVLTQKVICPEFSVIAKMRIDRLKNEEQAGLVIIGDQYAYLAIRKDKLGVSLVYVESRDDGLLKTERIHHRQNIEKDLDVISLKLDFRNEYGRINVEMSVINKNNKFEVIGQRFNPNDNTWVGAKVGIFALALDTEVDHGYVEFESFKVRSFE